MNKFTLEQICTYEYIYEGYNSWKTGLESRTGRNLWTGLKGENVKEKCNYIIIQKQK